MAPAERCRTLQKMKRMACVASVGMMAAFVATEARAGGPWDHSGGTDGRFGSAMEACRDQLGTVGVYEVVDASPPDANGYSTCFVQLKGNSSGEKLPNGLVYLVGPQPAQAPSASASAPATPAAPAPTAGGSTAEAKAGSKPCDEKTDLRWFPSMKKSRLEKYASGPFGDVDAYAKPGACGDATKTVAGRLFGNSQGKVRPDRWGTQRKIPDHYFLRVKDRGGDLIVDSTLFQFFNVKEGFNGAVFVGTEAQLASTLDRLAKQCGPSQDDRMKRAVAGKSGKDLKAALWDDAGLKNSGDTLGPVPRGRGFEYR